MIYETLVVFNNRFLYSSLARVYFSLIFSLPDYSSPLYYNFFSAIERNTWNIKLRTTTERRVDRLGRIIRVDGSFRYERAVDFIRLQRA